jgi:hypothetical protein
MRVLPVALVAALAAATGFAQSPESDLATGTATAPEPEGGFLVPDVTSDVLTKADVDEERFSFKLGLAMLLDYTWIDQDEAAVSQVGAQGDTGEVRDSRITGRGEIRLFGTWQYQVTAQYKGFDRERRIRPTGRPRTCA